jgi:chorismate synthase
MALVHLAPKLLIQGFASRIGPLTLNEEDLRTQAAQADTFEARFPSPGQTAQLKTLLQTAKAEGKSYGGTAQLRVTGVPTGLGQPVFHKLKSDLASALFGVGATSAVEIGSGKSSAAQEGSAFHTQSESPYGGMRGGISTGETLEIRVDFKPTSSILDVAKKGRHDPCIVPRAIPVLEAMVAIVLVDHLLWSRSDRI